MPKPNQQLAESLAALQEIQKGGRHVFRSRELEPHAPERLLRNGFLREVMKGWLMSSSRARARATAQHGMRRSGNSAQLLPGPV